MFVAGSNLSINCMVAFMVAEYHDMSIKYSGGISGSKMSDLSIKHSGSIFGGKKQLDFLVPRLQGILNINLMQTILPGGL